MAVSFVAVGNAAGQHAGTTTIAGTCSITPTLPAGTANDTDRVFVFQSYATAASSAATPANWTALYKDVLVGTGTPAAGAGQRRMSCYYRDKTSGWSAIPAFDLASTAQASHSIGSMTLRKGAGETWDTPTVSSVGTDYGGTVNTAFSATTSAAFTTIANALLTAHVVTNDNVTMTSGAITGTNGFTSGTVTERVDGGTATGNDVSIKLHTCSPSAAGSPAGTLTHTGTLSAASEGAVHFVQQTSTTPPSGTMAASLQKLTADFRGPVTAISGLVDGFNTKDTTIWTWSAGADVSGGAAVLTPAGGTAKITSGYWDIANSEAIVEVPSAGAAGITRMRLYEDADTYLETSVNAGTIEWKEAHDGSTSAGSDTYNSTTHRWWRIKYDATNDDVIFDTSLDGVTWTNRRTDTSPFKVYGAVQVELYADGASGSSTFDNFNNPPPPLPYTDDFNRADASSLGHNWTVVLGAGMGIASNQAYALSALYPIVAWEFVMPSDDMEVSVTVGNTMGSPTTAQDEIYFLLGASANGSEYAGLWTENDGEWIIYSYSGGWGAGETVRSTTTSGPTFTTGDVIKLRRIGNVYTGLKNGVQVLTWTDSGNVVPRDSSHRYVGLSGFVTGGNGRKVDSWTAGTPSTGTMAAALQKPTAEASGAQVAPTGTIAAALQKPTAAASGAQVASTGTIAAALQRNTFAGTATAPTVKAELLTDTWATQDNDKWVFGNSTVSSGQLNVMNNNVHSRGPWDITNSYYLTEVISTTENDNWFYFWIGPEGTTTYAGFYGIGSTLGFSGRVGFGTEIPWNATDHRWLRLRETSGTLYFETSPNGHAWTIRYSEVHGEDLTTTWPEMYTNSWDPLVFDNFNIPPPPSGTMGASMQPLTASASGSGGATSADGTIAAATQLITAAFTGTHEQTGTVAAALQRATASLTGAHIQTGTIAAALQRMVFSGAGVMQPSGTIAATLQRLTADLQGAHIQTGTAAMTLQRLTAALQGYMVPSGTATMALQRLTAAMSGAQIYTGTAAVTLQRLVMAAAGEHIYTGTIAADLQRLTAALAGAQIYTGMMAADLQRLVMALSGAQIYTGTIAADLQRLLMAATGVMHPTGAVAADLRALTTSLSGEHIQTGAAAAVLQALRADLTGAMQPTGTITAELQRLSAALAGEQIYTGTVAADLQRLVMSASGVMEPSGTIDAVLQALTVEFAGTPVQTGTITAALQALTASAVAAQAQSGTVTAALIPLTAALAGFMRPEGAVAAALQALTAGFAGEHAQSGVVAAALVPLTMAATGVMPPEGAITAALQALTADLSGSPVQTGTIAATLQRLTADLQGYMLPSGNVAADLQRLTAALAGEHTQTGTVDAVLMPLVLAAAGVIPPSGTVDATLQRLIAELAGEQVSVSTLTAVLQPLTAAMSGYMRPDGTIDAALQRLVADFAGAHIITGTSDVTLRPMVVDLAGYQRPEGTVDAVFQRLITDLTGAQTATSTVNATMQPLTAALIGATPYEGAMAAILTPTEFSGAGAQLFTGAMNTTLMPVVFTGLSRHIIEGALSATIPALLIAAEGEAGIVRGTLSAGIPAVLFTADGLVITDISVQVLDRTFIVTAESRTTAVRGESRTAMIRKEERQTGIRKESRINGVRIEPRTLVVQR